MLHRIQSSVSRNQSDIGKSTLLFQLLIDSLTAFLCQFRRLRQKIRRIPHFLKYSGQFVLYRGLGLVINVRKMFCRHVRHQMVDTPRKIVQKQIDESQNQHDKQQHGSHMIPAEAVFLFHIFPPRFLQVAIYESSSKNMSGMAP